MQENPIKRERRMQGKEEIEMEKMESRKSRFCEEGRRRRRRRRKATMETSFDTYLVHSSDSMGGGSGRFDFNHDDDDELLMSLAIRACPHGPVPDPEKEKLTNAILTHLSSPLQEAKNQQENRDPTRNSSTHFPKECRNQKHLPESIPLTTRKKLLRQRTGSLDLNSHVSADVAVFSPYTTMTKNNFPSPNPPGWQSERVPLGSHKYSLTGRTKSKNFLPSKWEDAERWIFSPVSSEMGPVRSKTQVPKLGQRRVKSKSGPLGSPLSPGFHSGRVGNFAKNSPLWAGVLVPENGIGGTGGGTGGSFSKCVSSCSLPSSRGSVQEDRVEITRKDVGTQTSPSGSPKGSPKTAPLFSSSSSKSMEVELEETHFTELEINNKCKAEDETRDDKLTIMRWSKKHLVTENEKCLTNIVEWKRRVVEENRSSCSCQAAETTNCISKFDKEEDKITAWENMQKVKAEAAIQKLVMRLEEKRSSSIEKILNKLKFAHKRANDMRTQVSTQEVSRNTKRGFYGSKNGQITSLSGCFTCHAF